MPMIYGWSDLLVFLQQFFFSLFVGVDEGQDKTSGEKRVVAGLVGGGQTDFLGKEQRRHKGKRGPVRQGRHVQRGLHFASNPSFLSLLSRYLSLSPCLGWTKKNTQKKVTTQTESRCELKRLSFCSDSYNKSDMHLPFIYPFLYTLLCVSIHSAVLCCVVLAALHFSCPAQPSVNQFQRVVCLLAATQKRTHPDRFGPASPAKI